MEEKNVRRAIIIAERQGLVKNPEYEVERKYGLALFVCADVRIPVYAVE